MAPLDADERGDLPLLVDAHDTLYGVTELGGKYGAGVAFSMSKAGNTWNYTTVYPFQGLPDAGYPYGGLIADLHGGLYGTTYFGGVDGLGSAFEIGPGPTVLTRWKESVMYSFQGGTDASFPTSTLAFDPEGNLYGTGSTGGNPSCDCGAIFKLTPHSGGGWDESVLHAFGGSGGDGQAPSYGLTPDGLGNYFGVTPVGGIYGHGVVFQITP